MLVITSPGTRPSAAAGIPTTGGGSGPTEGGPDGTRMSPAVAGIPGQVGEPGLNVNEGLIA